MFKLTLFIPIIYPIVFLPQNKGWWRCNTDCNYTLYIFIY